MSDKERRRIRLNSGYITTERSPLESRWEGRYVQRLEFYNINSNTVVVCDVSAQEINYWIERLSLAREEIAKRMMIDLGRAATGEGEG